MESSQPIPVVRKGFATKKQKEKQLLEERAEESKKPNALDAYKDFMEQERPKTPEVLDEEISEKAQLQLDIEDLQEKLKKHIKREPQEPDQDDCCGEGCNPCVFDTYYDKLEKYKERKDDIESQILEYEEDL